MNQSVLWSMFVLVFLGLSWPVRASVAMPDAEAITAVPDEVFDAAVAAAARNAVASLLARQSAPENEAGLVFPPVRSLKHVDWKNVPTRYRLKMIEVPIYEYDYAEQLVPKRNEYGSITGYEKKRVITRRRVVRTEKQERLVRDPEGDVVKDRRVRVYDKAGMKVYSRGFYGLNGMALYALCRAGLENDDRTWAHAEALSRVLAEHGLPDHTGTSRGSRWGTRICPRTASTTRWSSSWPQS